MAVQSQKSIMSVLIGGDVAGTAIATLVTNSGTQDITTYLPEGQVIVLGSTVTGSEVPIAVGATTITYPSIRFAVKNDGVVNYSNRIFATDVVSARSKDGVAAVEQVSSIGYNGSTGSIDTTGTDYTFTFVGDWNWGMWEEQKFRKAYNYYDTSPTQQEIAVSFATQFNFDMMPSINNGVGNYAKAEMLNSGTAAFTASGSATLLGVVNGSDVVNIYSTGTTRTADTGISSIGAILRIGNTSTSATGMGVTVPVYVVTQTATTDSTLVTGQVRVNMAFQGTTDAAVLLGTDAGIVTAGTNWGVKFTGLPVTWGIPPYSDFKFEKVTFHFDLKGFGSTTVSYTTNASRGQGVYQEVAEFEQWSSGNDGALNRTVIPLTPGRKYVGSTNSAVTLYDTFIVEVANRQTISSITGITPMRQQNYIFSPDTSNGNAMMVLFLSQLNPWLNAIPMGLPNLSTTV